MLARRILTGLTAGCLLVGALFLLGCEGFATDSMKRNLPGEVCVLPDAIGNYWVHDYLDYRGGALVDSAADSMLIENNFEWNGETWFELREQLRAFSTLNYYQIKADGVWMLNIQHGDTVAGLFFKYPTQVNDQWVNGGGDTMTTRSVTAWLSMPSGDYTDCIHYQFLGNADDEGMWLKPGVGWICSHWYAEGDTEQWFKMRAYRVLE